jgi:hypothetical protein
VSFSYPVSQLIARGESKHLHLVDDLICPASAP